MKRFGAVLLSAAIPLAAGNVVTDWNTIASATIVRIPDPRFPRLQSDASPYLVKADGTYQQVRDGDFDVSLPAIKAESIVGRIPNYNTRKVRVQLSHWSQLLALPLTAQVALASADNTRKAR